MPLPDVSWLSEAGPRRPGELHEPVVLGSDAERQLERASRAARKPAALTARLLVESALLRADLRCVGRGHSEAVLDDAARAARVSRRLSAGEADYLRALLMPARGEAAGVVTMAVRLLGRLAELDLIAAFAAEDALRAAQWEAAALMEGRTMLEWGLLVALRASG